MIRKLAFLIIPLLVLALENAPLNSVCTGGFGTDPTNKNKFICISDCYGNQREATELDCVFPFRLQNGSLVYNCISRDGMDGFWCSLDQVYQNRFVNCGNACPKRAEINYGIHTTCLKEPPGIMSFLPDLAAQEIILKLHNNIRAQVKIIKNYSIYNLLLIFYLKNINIPYYFKEFFF